MNSRKALSKSTNAAADAGGTSSVKVNQYEEYSYEGGNVVRLNHQMKDLEIEPNQDADRGLTWNHSINQLGVTGGKGMNASSVAPKAWGPSQGTQMQSLGDTGAGRISHDSWPKVINSKESVGGESSKAQQLDSSWGSWGTAYKVPSAAIHPPLQNGWQWSARAGKPGLQTNTPVKNCNMHPQDELPQDVDNDIEDDDELLDDSEDDFSDGFDSDDSQKSHDTRKKNKWLKPFFESLDNLNLEQINEQARQWHCPACQGGPGAIDWYTGLQPLMTHAKTKGRMRMRLHRELAELLEEELRRRGTSIIPAGEAFGKWMGLCETTPDHEIVWPPMVVVMNTLLEKDEKDKWKGMGNQELLEYFNTYEAVKARHSYGPNGHRGMSVLIFESSALGYFEAERLHRQFRGEGRDRDAWEKRPTLFYPGGKRQLYGFLASKEDLIIFNQHSHDFAEFLFHRKLNSLLLPIEGTPSTVNELLPMDFQEKFVKDQMDKIHKITEDKEKTSKNLSQERAKVNLYDVSNSGTIVDCRQREEEMQKFIPSQLKGVEEFEAERAKLILSHEEKKIELKQKHLTEEIELGNNFEAELTKLIEKYSLPSSQISKDDRQGSAGDCPMIDRRSSPEILKMRSTFNTVRRGKGKAIVQMEDSETPKNLKLSEATSDINASTSRMKIFVNRFMNSNAIPDLVAAR
ncbi:Protein SUPPRESSOR OF GENE SILENCING 3 like [Dendrobium catenatum]|uniref:Protein SUPPRESSOR OF GENE SILENCING 3 like n=1 Tax=Dendrobium catenatum TaxID=906689 RepID=A0A2I0XIF7_9ASPA|nr:Protein SUPPRESSOR OF GENE SILENCING 3 like [Dendrobium catenatum]